MDKLEEILRKKFDLENVDINKLVYDAFIRCEIHDLDDFTESKYSREELQKSTIVYGIKYNEKSKHYFSKSLSHYNPMETTDGRLVLVVFTFKKDEYEYFSSNSTKLTLDLTLELGITEKDILEQNRKYYNYKSAKNIIDNYDKFI
ncbi:hypothetical protein [Enterococcus sp.]|uniref:hypothetical protein n=1 Tax=Enterococcus sp. TaxID=35783 RepID=UPI00289A6235|nr:hypothetical protein [Enterococcus sp.]